MESQTLAALIAKRDEIREAIFLLEARPPARAGLAFTRLIERLRMKAEWLDKTIDLELQQLERLRGSEARLSQTNSAA